MVSILYVVFCTFTAPECYKCRHCPQVFSRKYEQVLHFAEKHQAGGGVVAEEPWAEHPEQAPWVLADGTIDNDLRRMYNANRPIILRGHQGEFIDY